MKHAKTLVAVAFTVACGGAPTTAPESAASSNDAPAAEGSSPETGASAEPSGPRPPDFELETLKGDTVRLSDHLGKDVVLIDFWATYCRPCLVAMPHLNELYEKHKSEGFVVLGVSIDDSSSVAQVRSEVERLGVTFPILLDQESRVVGLYNPKTSAPYSVLVGRNGGILSKREGYSSGDASEIDAEVASALR